VFRFPLGRSPFDKQAVAQAPEHAHDPNAVGTPDATAIVVVRDVQSLMGAVFDAPGVAVELEPAPSGQLCALPAGDQGDALVLATIELDAPTIAAELPMRIGRWDSFSVTNASENEAKLTYID